MNTTKILKIYLIVSGLILTAIGSLTSFNLINIKANEGINIAGNPSALNDVRSFGVLLLATAILLFLGSFKRSLTKSANIAAFLLFLALGLGRLLSIFLDGMPSEGMVKATGLEIILGLVGLVLFKLYNKQQSY